MEHILTTFTPFPSFFFSDSLPNTFLFIHSFIHSFIIRSFLTPFLLYTLSYSHCLFIISFIISSHPLIHPLIHHHIHHPSTPLSDQSTFLSSDDLRVCLWDVSRVDTCYTLTDVCPSDARELTAVLTAAAADPTHPSLFTCGNSKGTAMVHDMRTGAHCTAPALRV